MGWREELDKLLEDCPPKLGFFQYEIHYIDLNSGSIFTVNTYAESPQDALDQTRADSYQFVLMKQIFV